MRRFVAALSATLVLSLGQSAAAFDNDFEYSRLGVPGNAVPERAADPFAQERFARFVGDLAMAIAPNPSAPMYTLGAAAFELAFTADVALVNPTQTFNDGNVRDVWPTIGPRPQALFMPTVHLRKGLPFSLQAGTSIGYITGSSMAVSSFDLKWALLEGLQWWPSIGVRAFGSVLVNSGPMLLVLGGWDVGGDYRFPIAGGLEAVGELIVEREFTDVRRDAGVAVGRALARCFCGFLEGCAAAIRSSLHGMPKRSTPAAC